MNTNIEIYLNEEIEKEIIELGKMELGTENYKTTVDGICKLMDKSMDIKKVRISREDKSVEYDTKEFQMLEERKDKKHQIYLQVAGIVVPVVVTVWGTLKSFEFEKTGTVTTILGRKFVNNLIKK